MKSVAVNTDVEGVDHILDDLAKGQRYNCKVVTFKPQYWNSNKKSKKSSKSNSYYESQHKSWSRRELSFHDFGKKCTCESSNAHKSAMSNGQLSQNTYAEVQRHSDHCVICHRNKKSLHMA